MFSRCCAEGRSLNAKKIGEGCLKRIIKIIKHGEVYCTIRRNSNKPFLYRRKRRKKLPQIRRSESLVLTPLGSLRTPCIQNPKSISRCSNRLVAVDDLHINKLVNIMSSSISTSISAAISTYIYICTRLLIEDNITTSPHLSVNHTSATQQTSPFPHYKSFHSRTLFLFPFSSGPFLLSLHHLALSPLPPSTPCLYAMPPSPTPSSFRWLPEALR